MRHGVLLCKLPRLNKRSFMRHVRESAMFTKFKLLRCYYLTGWTRFYFLLHEYMAWKQPLSKWGKMKQANTFLFACGSKHFIGSCYRLHKATRNEVLLFYLVIFFISCYFFVVFICSYLLKNILYNPFETWWRS